MEIINNKGIITFSLIVILYLSYYLVHLFYLVPLLPFDNDTLHKISWVLSNESIISSDHHSMRWGSYLPIKFLSFFTKISFFKLAFLSFIFLFFAGFIYLYIAHTFFGFLYSLVFLIFWVTSKSINLDLFALSVNTHSLLALSLLVLYLLKVQQDNKFTLLNSFILSVIIFYIYGIKETNIFFFPLLIFLKAYRDNYKFLLSSIIFLIIFYFIESCMFYYFSNKEIIFGRIFDLLFSIDGGHIKQMVQDGTKHFSDLSTFESYFLPFYRWYSARDWDTSIFYLSFIVSVFFLLRKNGVNFFNQTISLLILSFFIFNTLFIVSLKPVIMGQILASRYLTVLLPFSFLILISGFYHILKNSIKKYLSIFLFMFIFFTFLSRPVYSLIKLNENFGYLSLASHFNNSLWKRDSDYKRLAKEISTTDCVFVESTNPFIYKIVDSLNFFVTNEIASYKWVKEGDPSFINVFKKNKNIECNKKIILKDDKILF